MAAMILAMFLRSLVATATATVPATVPAAGSLCPEWETASEAGRLETKLVDESSGLAISRKYPRFYHVNDSGDGPYFYVSERDGSKTQKVKIRGFKPYDVEEIGLGPCPGSQKDTCVVVADIGDNRERRKKIEILFIKEEERFPSEVDAFARWELKYPDRAHNAEAMALTPQGNVVIVTKESAKGVTRPAQLFSVRLAADEKKGTLKKIGEIDVPKIVNGTGLEALVTAMSQTSDGARFALLTYRDGIEFALSLDDGLPKSSLRSGRDYAVVPLTPLIQQEGLSYDTNEKDLIYTSEDSLRLFTRASSGSLMRVKCKKPSSP